MKTTLDLPDELIRAVKMRAVVQGKSVKGLVAELLRRGLGLSPAEPESAANPVLETNALGLPIIRGASDAPARHMSVAELLALERESQNEEDEKRARLAP